MSGVKSAAVTNPATEDTLDNNIATLVPPSSSSTTLDTRVKRFNEVDHSNRAKKQRTQQGKDALAIAKQIKRQQ